MDEQSRQLEFIVREKTRSLVEERDNVDALLAEMLPKSVVHKLRLKQEILPEKFDSASVLFSDIPGFSHLLSTYSPWDIVSLLNSVYSEFDRIFGLYDTYKVETINDSYMVASGVPTPNGTDHAAELCLLSLQLLTSARSCLAAEELSARVGINSGPVVAGVIGRKMPRYCLFGDTVNTASRMETHGEAGKVHVSHSVERLAFHRDNLRFVLRGTLSIKSKGEMQTFWLEPLKSLQ
ncbi:atrial natriuretic peptide receptor 1-like [Paramacrobiotus metropolitanus]|uniref:atrial natriuretic peptide receptor 1-like n=1 Tax=Paramacrobiotus metropolitanus TaxID=2943436 RepID=UPI002445B3DD|nr:atrial natriuretic peptide receptor 1-like [Paramacrobiotus metropolitanus]